MGIEKQMTYCGRFAPTPNGPLHFGSLVTAAASFLHARSRGGRWLVRIEDIDEPRTAPGSSSLILRQLECAALFWDGEVVVQSERKRFYREALESLSSKGLLFGCSCSRSLLQQIGHKNVDGSPFYPGTCRYSQRRLEENRAVRVRVSTETFSWTDQIFGEMEQDLSRDVGDFVILCADGIFSGSSQKFVGSRTRLAYRH